MISPFFSHIECAACGHTQSADVMAAACPECGSGWLDARYDYDRVKPIWADGLSERAANLWRYQELIPIDQRDPEVSMTEGSTPLLRLYPYERMYDHAPIFVKDERQGPTSSFKDRQAALAVTALKRAGITSCVLASTGNAGAAYAAYCARAGIKLWLFLTHLVPDEKMREAALYGAEVVKVDGTYDEAKTVAAEFAQRKGFHLDRGARAIPGKEAMKTIAFELAEQLALEFDHRRGRWVAPDWYIQAVSGGIGPLGVWKGFEELLRMSLIDKMPKLGIIQAAGCAPMVEAHQRGDVTAAPVIPQTLIHVLATGDPGFSYIMLDKAVRSNGGVMLSIEDGEAFAAMRRVASTAGLSVEPATAVAFAGLEQMLYEGIIDSDEIVVVNCSGHTFPAESHVLGDQYLLNLNANPAVADRSKSLSAALQTLDEQVTTILIVDDNPNDRRLLRKLLRANKNYRLFETDNGKQALVLAAEHSPDLIVTDLTMPGMDGLTLIEQLKWNPSTADIPIVVVSAKTINDDDLRTIHRYAVSVWIKGNYETRQLVKHLIAQVEVGNTALGSLKQGIIDRPVTDSLVPRTTVLLIDADAAYLDKLNGIVQQTEHVSVFQASSGRDGLKRAHEHHPDVIVCALSLPDMTAENILESLRKDAGLRQTPVILYADDAISDALRHRLEGLQALTIRKREIAPEQMTLMMSQALALVG
jgi:threonine synthase